MKEQRQLKIVFVDDEEGVLSSARRLLRGKDIKIETFLNPVEALDYISKSEVAVVVSDYKMPQMTGTDFLQQVKNLRPEITRLMLTGYLEYPIIQDSINRASVFRFVTKPWDDADLVLGLEAALKHNQRIQDQQVLLSEISVQNSNLELMTKNLELEVTKRTRGIEESTNLADDKQRSVKALTRFIKTLSQINDMGELWVATHRELKSLKQKFNAHFLLREGASLGKVLWVQSDILHEKNLSRIPFGWDNLDIRSFTLDELSWWKQHFKSSLERVTVFPIRFRDVQHGSTVAAYIFISHHLEGQNLGNFIEAANERLQPLSVVLDRLSLRQQLEVAAAQWEGTFNGFRAPIAVVDSHDRVIRANKIFFKPGFQYCFEMFDRQPGLCSGCPMPKAFHSKVASSGLVRTKEEKVFRVNSYPIADTGDSQEMKRVVNYYHNLSRERDLYIRLVQSEKLAAIGLLAGNIAHELNNPLAGIRSLAQVMLSEIKQSEPIYADLVEVEKASSRCQGIIDNLLHFSEPVSDAVEEVDVNQQVNATLPLLKSALRTQNVRLFLEPTIQKVRIQSSQLQQVLFNLINNACQAMATGGVLTIKSWNERGSVCISISDTGPGIPKELHVRIFESFFTTKAAGKGTGLGLSVSKNIIEKFSGELLLDSKVGQGTVFTIKLPASTRNH